jgi:hypothetical protein
MPDSRDGAACRFARDNFGASFDLDAECGTTCDDCGSPLTDRGAHGLGCEQLRRNGRKLARRSRR